MSINEIDKLSSRTSSDLLSSLLSEERPITVDEACSLRLLLFGNTSSTFGEEWTAQGFCFKPHPLSYGLTQKKAGPCGVLAAVQANVLFELLFGSSNIPLSSGLLRPKLVDKRRALSQALCSILWQAGERKSAVYAVRRKTVIMDDSIAENVLKKDGLLEYLHLKYFKSKDDLLEFLYNFISEMMQNDSESCVLFLYSVILTHGIEKIKKEMDVPESHLIGNDGYCSQEIVNLLLTGKAVPNLFDGNLELNSGGPETSLLRGISKRSKIGLLSSYEYKNTCAVGQFYKNPFYPIWLLLCESHFTVLFGTDRNILKENKAKDAFQLFHYDGLLKKNDKETIFNINPIGRLEEQERDKTENSVLQCIYTRWPLALIEQEKDKEGNAYVKEEESGVKN